MKRLKIYQHSSVAYLLRKLLHVRKSLFLSLEVKNPWIFNLSWGGMKGPYGPFPFVIGMAKDIMWCLRGGIVIKLNKATSTAVKNRSVGSMGSNGSWGS